MLDEKVALVTGGSGGIGSAIARRLAFEGAHVAVAYLQSRQAAEQVVADIVNIGRRAVALQADVRDAESVGGLVRQTVDYFGGIDILINCAGIAYFHPLNEYSESDWDTVVATNLKGTYLCCRAALPYFTQRGGGNIVNISSLSASTGSFEGGAYAASKAGINLLTLSLALELAAFNIRVNALAPGRISTPFRRTHSGTYFDFMIEQTPMKRMGTPDEVANAAVFMASRACAFMTGETLYVTGGLHTVYLQHVTPDQDSKLRGT